MSRVYTGALLLVTRVAHARLTSQTLDSCGHFKLRSPITKVSTHIKVGPQSSSYTQVSDTSAQDGHTFGLVLLPLTDTSGLRIQWNLTTSKRLGPESVQIRVYIVKVSVKHFVVSKYP